MTQLEDPVPPGRREAEARSASGDAGAETRRQAIRRLGRFAAYTAPAMLAMLAATTAASGDSLPPP